MKIKLTALICIVAMLAGCGSAATETTAAPETQPTEPQLLETTAATLATTEPTEPKSFFEEQGLSLWAGEECRTMECFFDENGYQISASSEGSIVYGTGDFVKFNMALIGYPSFERAEVITKNIVSSTMSVSIWEYFSKDFNAIPLQDTIDAFYNARTELDMSKEEWLTAHENYKILHCETEQYIYTSAQIDEDMKQGADYFGLYGEEPAIMDMNTGEIFLPSMIHPEVVNTFPVRSGDSEFVMTAVFDFTSNLLKNTGTNYYGDMDLTINLYVLVPAENNELVFVYPEVEELEADEEYYESAEEERAAWEVKKYTDYVNELDGFQLRFYAMVK